MEQKSPATYIGIGITIGVLLTVILIYILGAQPQSISIGLVDFSLPNTPDENLGVNPTLVNQTPVNPTPAGNGAPECKIGNNTGIAGQVVTESGLPISGVNITSEPPTESVLTDINGFYLICNIPAEGSGRQYIVIARKSGYYDTQLTVSAMGYSTIVANIILKSAP
jgi:hypothetical protein